MIEFNNEPDKSYDPFLIVRSSFTSQLTVLLQVEKTYILDLSFKYKQIFLIYTTENANWTVSMQLS